MEGWSRLAEQARLQPGVVGVAPYVEMQAMIGRGLDLSGAQIRGIRPEVEGQVADLGRFMKQGSLDDLVPGERRIVLGAGLAFSLDAQVGDELTVLIPQALGDSSATGVLDLRPRIQTFTISGIFEAGLQESDNVLALVALGDAAELAGTGGAPTCLRLKFDDIFNAPLAAPKLAAAERPIVLGDWRQRNSTFVSALEVERIVMFLILMLIVAVAAFNIVAALVMVVNEKRTDIAILRTLGLPPRSVVAIFMAQGVVIGWVGTLLGVGLGLSLAFNVESIVPFLEQLFGVRVMDPSVYYITEIPSEVHAGQVMAIAGIALVLSVLSTIYPSLRAAQTEPAEALRYE